jgi:predicted transcriptional regulator
VAEVGERNVDRRIREVKSLAEVIGAHAVFITYGERSQDERVPLIGHKVLTKMKCPEELLAQLS